MLGLLAVTADFALRCDLPTFYSGWCRCRRLLTDWSDTNSVIMQITWAYWSWATSAPCLGKGALFTSSSWTHKGM